MINLDNATISNIIIHKVGNSYIGDKSIFSSNELLLNQYEIEELKSIFIKNFKSQIKASRFYHSIELNQNVIFTLADKIFATRDNYVKETKNIVKYLFEQSTHYSIKSGEVFVLFFEGVTVGNVISNAIGIFKVENPTDFIKSHYEKEFISLYFDKGIIGKNLEKGCLVFNTDYKDGFIVYSYEKNSDTNYWAKDFLSIKNKNDDFNATNTLLESYRNFVINDLNDESMTKKDKIEMISKSIDFVIETKSSVNVEDFIKSNFPGKEAQKLFKNYLTTYEEANEIRIENDFTVSSEAIKFQKKQFKSIIKLDKNFHIYIHGNRDLIEQGYDSKSGKRFYKIYFENEA